MVLRRATLALVAILLIAPTAVAAACRAPVFPAGSARTIPADRPDQGLFSAAVLAAVNAERCKAGRGELAGEGGLTGVAAAHAGWMARAQKLSHRSTTPGQTSLKAWLKASGATFRTGAENIAAYDRYAYGTQVFVVKDAARCRFTQNGRAVPAHSYESLARAVVAGWMASSGHRKNILDRRMKLVGSGLALDRKAPNCGRFYIAQDFAG